MNLMCMDRNWISLILMTYHVMSIVSGLIFGKVPDRWGYKKTIRVFGCVNLLAQIIVLLVPNYYVRLICFGVMGLCYTRYLVPYAWATGFLMEKHLSIVNGLMSGYD